LQDPAAQARITPSRADREEALVADTGVTVVGAGVVGLAIAARLAAKVDLVILERGVRHGLETSSRNSEVIHAGLYYPKDSLKARLCVAGNRALYELCARKGIPHRRITKIITASSPEELPSLEALLLRGRGNGVELAPLSGAEACRLEPHMRSVGALLSPRTGIVSAHGLMDFFLNEARAAGAVVRFGSALEGVERGGEGYTLKVRRGPQTETFTSECVVNAAGLEADRVAERAGIDLDAAGYRVHYCKGSYFAVRPGLASLVSRLVYPVPGPTSLGVHAVLDLGGRLRFGPDAEYLDGRTKDYAVDPSRVTTVGPAVRHVLPEIRDEDLAPDIAGIRPKLQGQGEPFRDFVIAEESSRGLPGFVNLLGIDSPGLTAAPAIAESVAALLGL
jgi:L-2-hydroxyglutarate oxidase LhgO